jgi:hypothetical protein
MGNKPLSSADMLHRIRSWQIQPDGAETRRIVEGDDGLSIASGLSPEHAAFILSLRDLAMAQATALALPCPSDIATVIGGLRNYIYAGDQSGMGASRLHNHLVASLDLIESLSRIGTALQDRLTSLEQTLTETNAKMAQEQDRNRHLEHALDLAWTTRQRIAARESQDDIAALAIALLDAQTAADRAAAETRYSSTIDRLRNS